MYDFFRDHLKEMRFLSNDRMSKFVMFLHQPIVQNRKIFPWSFNKLRVFFVTISRNVSADGCFVIFSLDLWTKYAFFFPLIDWRINFVKFFKNKVWKIKRIKYSRKNHLLTKEFKRGRGAVRLNFSYCLDASRSPADISKCGILY